MPDLEKIKDKIRKIEEMAKSPVKEEADTARKLAQKLRKEHGIFGSLDESAKCPVKQGSDVYATKSSNRDIYIKRYVLRDRSEDEIDEIMEILNRVIKAANREFNLDCEIRWNTSTETEKIFFFFSRKIITIWISILAPSRPMLARMCSMFLALADKRTSEE